MPQQSMAGLVGRFEEAYAEFGRGEADVLDTLGLRATGADVARLAELRQRVHAGGQGVREAAEEILALFGDTPCSPVFDSVVAYGLGDLAGDPRRAAEVRVVALRWAAVWHPGHGG